MHQYINRILRCFHKPTTYNSNGFVSKYPYTLSIFIGPKLKLSKCNMIWCYHSTHHLTLFGNLYHCKCNVLSNYSVTLIHTLFLFNYIYAFERFSLMRICTAISNPIKFYTFIFLFFLLYLTLTPYHSCSYYHQIVNKIIFYFVILLF